MVLLGPRVGATAKLTSWLALDVHAESLLTPTDVAVQLGSSNVWSTAPISGFLGAGLVGTIP